MKEVRLTACSHEQDVFVLKDREKLIKTAVDILRTWRKDFDAIAVSGYSSAMTAPIIASRLRKNLVLVRKPSEERFSNHSVEGIWGQRVLFLDDLVDSGNTFRRIKSGLKDINCEIVGFYLYKQPDMTSDNFDCVIQKMDIPKEV